MGLKKSRKAVKWVVYTLFALLLFCFQSAPQRFGILEGVVFLLPFAVAISCYEGIVPSAVVASLCGLFWDYSAQRVFGFHALILCVICVAVSLVMKFYVRPVFLSVIVAIAVSTVVYCLADFFFFYVLRGYEGAAAVFVSHYLPSLIKTSIFGAATAFITEKIYKISPAKAKFDE